MASSGDLDDQSDDPGGVALPVDHDDITHLAEAIARGVKDAASGQARDEDPLRAHPTSVVRGTRVSPGGASGRVAAPRGKMDG